MIRRLPDPLAEVLDGIELPAIKEGRLGWQELGLGVGHPIPQFGMLAPAGRIGEVDQNGSQVWTLENRGGDLVGNLDGATIGRVLETGGFG